ncbi:MAG: paraquat-inducible protein A [Endozoicomonas sp.]
MGHLSSSSENPGVYLPGQMWLCPECDLLIRPASRLRLSRRKRRVCCPRCHHVLHCHNPGGQERCLALVISGLLLFLPAMLFPVLSMEILGSEQKASMLDGVRGLYQEGLTGVAALVFFSAVLAPLVRLLVLLQVLLAVFLNRGRWLARRLFRGYLHLGEWGMVEIYLLGVLVSVIKLADMASVHPGIGLFSFAGLMLAELGISINMSEHDLWEGLGYDRKQSSVE